MLLPAPVAPYGFYSLPRYARRPRRGVGALNQQSGYAALGTATSILPVIAGAMSSTATVASATGLAPMLTAIGISGPAAPFVAAAIAVALPVFKLIKALASGCGETCLVTSNWANQAEEALKEINRQYFAQPSRTRSSQAQFLQLVDEVFRQLRELCSNPATGAAGQRCISERLVRGGTAPWCDKPGRTGCDWYALYFDPIANDNGAVADPDVITSLFGGSGSGSSFLGGYGIPLALALGALFLVGDN